LVVGRVLRPHGVRGEVKIAIHTGYPERLATHKFFYLSHPHTPDAVHPYLVERVRVRADVALVKLGGRDSRNDVEELRGMWVQVPVEKAAPLDPGEYYQYQLVGVSVETEGGEWLGQIADVLETGANDVYLVLGPYGEVLLPAIEEVVRTIDIDARRMVVHLLPGLLDEDIA
jgi:16S rRNA processing protein RimM